jgi:hypothetical protein
MNQESGKGIVDIIGRDSFIWLSKEFNTETRLKDLPDEILKCVSSANITLRDYAGDRNVITAIALITFAYKVAGKIQHPKYGPNDIVLLKILSKNELSRRNGKKLSKNPLWNAPLFDLITGEVGERIRKTKFMINPI